MGLCGTFKTKAVAFPFFYNFCKVKLLSSNVIFLSMGPSISGEA